MESKKPASKKLYDSMDDIEIKALGKTWDSEEFKGLFRYDVLKIVAFAYLFSDRNERRQIENNVAEVFDLKKSKRELESVLDGFNARNVISGLFLNIPYSVAVKYLEDDRNETEFDVGTVLLAIVHCCFSCLEVGDRVVSGIRIAILIFFYECCSIRLRNEGITDNESLIDDPKSIGALVENWEIPGYEEISYGSDNAEKKTYERLKAFFLERDFLQLLDECSGKKVEINYTRKNIQAICDKMNDPYKDMSLSEMMDDLKRRLGIICEDSENADENDFDDDEESDDFDDSESTEEDEYEYEEYDTVKAQFERLEGKKCELREIFGDDCVLRIQNETSSEITYTGEILDCVRKASEVFSEEHYSGSFIIEHRINQDDSYLAPHPFYDIRAALFYIESKLQRLSGQEERLSYSIPFDSSILPSEYPHFDEAEVNETNFDILWRNLKRIENKYREGLIEYKDDDFMYSYGVNDWESECCYEQVKYLENVRWSGDAPAFDNGRISYTTIRKFNKRQLRYYLYWRGELFDGRVARSSDAYLFMCMYELVARVGDFTENERIGHLIRLTKAADGDYRYFIGKCESAIIDYQRIFNLVDKNALFSGDVTTWTHEWEYCAREILGGDYTHVFEVINYQASYHMYSGALNTRIPCADHMIQCIKSLMLPLHDLYTRHGLSFEKTLVGDVVPYTENRISSAVIWTDRVQNRLYGDQKSTCLICSIKSNPLAISDYLVKSVENSFRKFFKTGSPLKLTRMEDFGENPQRYWYYIENQTKEERDERRKYIAVFDELDDVIQAGIEEYFKLHDEELNELRNEYVPEKPITVSQPVYSFEKKTPVDEEMIEFISGATDDDGLVDKLLEIYDKASPSTKKSKAKKFRNWIWDFWILHRSTISYDELCERVTDNRWRIEEFIAIQSRDYVNAIPYLQSIHSICNGVVAKTIEKSVIADTVIVVFACLDGLFASYGIDFSEMILGRFKEEKWIPYNTDDGIQNNAGQSFVKNLGDVEIYIYDGENHEGRIKHYEESDEARDFTAYILKLIDNHFRAKIGSKTFLKNEYDNSQLQILVDNQTAFSFVEEVVSRVVGYFVDCSTGKYDFDAAITKDITLTDSSERDYVFAGCNDNNSIEQLVERNIKQYLGISDLVRTSNSALYDSVEIDLENFNFDDWINRYMDRKKVLHKLPYINIYRFYDIFPELVNRIDRVRGITADYDPYYNFVISKVMKAQSGLINKDLNALKFLGDDGQDFAQWITWINHGRFVFPKNEPFVQIFFHFAFNDWVLPDNRKACLVIMSQIWNYYFADYTLRDTASDLYLEWIKDYWMVNCDDVSYSDFKSLFKCDVEFANEKGVQSSKDHFFVDISTLDENDLLSFYNANCDYRVMDGSVVASRYGNLLEEALEAVHVGLKKLWAQYGLDFIDYLHYNDESIIVKERELYYRAILTGTTKRKLIDTFKGRKVSECEEYSCRYDYDRAWPMLVCKLKEISNSSSRVLMEYILKLTEKVVREWLSIPYGFKFDEERLYELFPSRLFEINAKNHIIESVITEIVLGVCEESGIQSKNAKIRAVLEVDESIDALNTITIGDDRRERMQKLYSIVSGRKDEYDPIERDQRVDSSSIEGAREVLRRNQNRLIVEDESVEYGDSASGSTAGVFTSEEEELLKILLSGDRVAERIEGMKQRFLAPNLLVESINEKAIDLIGDTVIEGYDSYEIVEEYIDEVEKLISEE